MKDLIRPYCNENYNSERIRCNLGNEISINLLKFDLKNCSPLACMITG